MPAEVVAANVVARVAADSDAAASVCTPRAFPPFPDAGVAATSATAVSVAEDAGKVVAEVDEVVALVAVLVAGVASVAAVVADEGALAPPAAALCVDDGCAGRYGGAEREGR